MFMLSLLCCCVIEVSIRRKPRGTPAFFLLLPAYVLLGQSPARWVCGTLQDISNNSVLDMFFIAEFYIYWRMQMLSITWGLRFLLPSIWRREDSCFFSVLLLCVLASQEIEEGACPFWQKLVQFILGLSMGNFSRMRYNYVSFLLEQGKRAKAACFTMARI